MSENNLGITHSHKKSDEGNWLSHVLSSYGDDSSIRHNAKHENSSLLIKSRGPVTRTVDSNTKITWRDFIPPVLFKLWRLLGSMFTKKGIHEVTRITYIELGVVAVFTGTLMIALLIGFNVPATFADLAYTAQMYINNEAYTSYVSSLAITKANQAKAFLEDYKSGVVLGVSGTLQPATYNQIANTPLGPNTNNNIDNNASQTEGSGQSVKKAPVVNADIPQELNVKSK